MTIMIVDSLFLQTSRQFTGKDEALKSIPQFCFPDIDQWKPTKNYKSESYSFVLTDMEGNRRYGYCRRLLVRQEEGGEGGGGGGTVSRFHAVLSLVVGRCFTSW